MLHMVCCTDIYTVAVHEKLQGIVGLRWGCMRYSSVRDVTILQSNSLTFDFKVVAQFCFNVFSALMAIPLLDS